MNAASLRVASDAEPIDTACLEAALDARGCATLPGLIGAAQCRALARLYDADEHFRSRVVMARHGFGRGEYRYFAYPLPESVRDLRTQWYPLLVPLANRWQERLGVEARFPSTHAEFVARCHAAGQSRPTPLLLRYGPDDFNCLHQDLYGEHVFPLQVAILLSQPGDGWSSGDFTGGEFVLTEQRPRMQSRVEVVSLRQGDAVVFAVHHRPVRALTRKDGRSDYRVNLRHGVSRVRSGSRHTLGIIFHDAS